MSEENTTPEHCLDQMKSFKNCSRNDLLDIILALYPGAAVAKQHGFEPIWPAFNLTTGKMLPVKENPFQQWANHGEELLEGIQDELRQSVQNWNERN